MSLEVLLSSPEDIELWIILFYVAGVLVGARLVEAVARGHFARAQSYGEQGFEYVAAHDAYRCPQGEYLVLQNVQPDSRLAVYRAPPASCRQCRLKSRCAPFSEGRLVFRSLAAWAETNVGVFHRRISVTMFAATVVICVAGLHRWAGQAGSGWLAGALLIGVVLLIQDVRTIFPTVRGD
jgi:hypothetical protein